MSITAKEIAKSLSSISLPPKAEADYKTLNKIGTQIVKDYFNKDPLDITDRKPWGGFPEKNKKGVVINKYKPFWSKLNTELFKEIDAEDEKRKNIKLAIYMGSQQLWLDEQAKDLPSLKHLTAEMKYRLIRLKNNDDKLKLLNEFFGPKTKADKTTIRAFVKRVKRCYNENKYCKQLLRDKARLEKQIEELKAKGKPTKKDKKGKAVVADKEPLKKPTITSVTQAVLDDKIVEILTDMRYLQYVIDPKHFRDVNRRNTILGILESWKGKADMYKELGQNLEAFYYAVRAGGMMAKK
ncbi:MAG: hypothetical protein ACLP5H_12005 [Desulfomonilaceae bacterium]